MITPVLQLIYIFFFFAKPFRTNLTKCKGSDKIFTLLYWTLKLVMILA